MFHDNCAILLSVIWFGSVGLKPVQAVPVTSSPAEIARRLVHEAKWAPTGTISSQTAIAGYPMVNTISIDDSNMSGKATGVIRFMLTDRDYTGKDWRKANVITMLFTDALNLKCGLASPMGHLCPRAYISGQVETIDKGSEEYKNSLRAFHRRHPESINWPQDANHGFYLAKLNIKHITVFAGHGGPKRVHVEQYYRITFDK